MDDAETGRGWSPRTDLAVEAHQLAKRGAQCVTGVEEEVEEGDAIVVTRVHVQTKAAERQLGKRRGWYITLDVPGLRHRDPELQADVSRRFAAELKRLLPVDEEALVLIVGLGNANVTPDALGPLVVKRLFVTRHLFHYLPEAVERGYRPVAAVAPGVLGVTGIETSEIVAGVVEHIRPDAIIAIDALASRALRRLNTTIQLADSGIQPGAGVGNKRRALDQSTLGVPVIAVGVPTVVAASTIANDCLELLLNELRTCAPDAAATQLFDHFNSVEKQNMMEEVLSPLGDNLVVTPKEIDEFIEDTAEVVARGLNLALHSALTEEEAAALTH